MAINIKNTTTNEVRQIAVSSTEESCGEAAAVYILNYTRYKDQATMTTPTMWDKTWAWPYPCKDTLSAQLQDPNNTVNADATLSIKEKVEKIAAQILLAAINDGTLSNDGYTPNEWILI